MAFKSTEKEKASLFRRLCKMVFLVLLVLNAGCASEQSFNSEVQAVSQKDSHAQYEAEPPLEVHFLDVGQADSILIKTSDAAMLVDAGKNEDGKNVVSYLQQQGIVRLDYVIGTHPHEDHIGGLDDVIRSFEIGNVILPEKVHTSKTYMDVLNAVQDKGLEITQADIGQEYRLGDAKFTVLSPKPDVDYGDNLNNWSVGIKLVYGNNSFVMTGDAEGPAESDIVSSGIDLKADVWKSGHHGSKTSNSEEMLNAVAPAYAVISCGVDNQYGHPDQEVLQRFAQHNIQVFRTDQQGTIIASSDGAHISWNVNGAPVTAGGVSSQAEVNTDQEKENTISEENSSGAEQDPIVHITNSGTKYHVAGCRYLKSGDIEVRLSEARDRGLEPCSVCNPPQ